jgi:sugar O-acyltransferase (sialic acid O-acetyltransferase NeuD family)
MGGAKIAIIGAGDLGVQLAHLCKMTGSDDIIGFFDDTLPRSVKVSNVPVLGSVENIAESYQERLFDQLLIAIGYRHMSVRSNLFSRFQGSIPFARLIHPNAYVDSHINISEGCVVMSGCILEMETTLKENVLLYNGCNLAHNSEIGAHSILSPGVAIAGFTQIGERNVLGIGSVFSDKLTTCNDCRTGAGATVIEDLVHSGLYVGIPAKKIKE